ncbi:TPA: hypothetical protein ACIAIE_005454 [Serratia fonticola]
MEWQYLNEEAGFDAGHDERLGQLSKDVLVKAIVEMTYCHPEVGALLRNKWLTDPEDILGRITAEYEERKLNVPRLRTQKEEQYWLNALSSTVLAPLENVAREQLCEAEAFIHSLFIDEEQLSGIVRDTWSWHCDLTAARLRVVMRNAQGRPDYLRESISKMLLESGSDFSLGDIRQWASNCSDDELKAVLQEYL